MTDYVLSIDPGLSTGIALLSYDSKAPAALVEGWQFGGGLMGLKKWLGQSVMPLRISGSPFHGIAGVPRFTAGGTTICEKYSPRPSNVTGFQQSLDTVEPLRCEGMLVDRGIMPDYPREGKADKTWRSPSLQYFAGGTGKAERKKKQHAFLKANGFYRTGKDFGTSDADDFRSACAHGINYIARELKHKPTFDMIANWEG